ncbi:phage antirepressor KilAC domain-containing protein, partial [Escherichia coli]|uniref:phage antirepressor KilAC domain-containing protein n=8 Tax=Escherichia coli TaxID=562 RepID=UPI001FCECCA5
EKRVFLVILFTSFSGSLVSRISGAVQFLLENGIMYRLAGKMTPYSHHLDAGRFSVKTGEAGNGHAFTQVKFTPKGVQWIAGLLAAWRATAA